MFVLSAGDESVGVRTAIVGDHHVYNCLAAAATALAYGIELTDDRSRPGSGRSAAGPDGTRHVRPGICRVGRCGRFARMRCELACEPRGKSRAADVICVFGTHDDCDSSELPAIGRVIGAMADVAVVTQRLSGATGRTARAWRCELVLPIRARHKSSSIATRRLHWALTKRKPATRS